MPPTTLNRNVGLFISRPRPCKALRSLGAPALLVGLALLSPSGCSSVYRKAQATQPAEAAPRLAERVRAARNEAMAALAGVKALARAEPGRARQLAAEQLQLRGWEVQRKALAVMDVANKGPDSGRASAASHELEKAGRAVVDAAAAASNQHPQAADTAAPNDLSAADQLTAAEHALQAAINTANRALPSNP